MQLLKQKYTGTLLGKLKLTYTYTAPYVNGGTALMTTMILYHTTAQHHFYAKLGWAPGYLAFLATFIVCYILFALIFVYKFEMPSTMGVNMDQQLKYSKVWNKFEARVINIENLLEGRKNREERIIRRQNKRS